MKLTDKETILNEIFEEQVEELQTKIESAFKDKDYDHNDKYIRIVVQGEYKPKVKQIVANNYRLEGWKSMQIVGSSQNGERPGLTDIKMYFEENY